MNKITLLLISLLFFIGSHSSYSQELGVRFGDAVGRQSVAIDFVKNTSNSTRVHANVGFGNGLGIEILWGAIRPFSKESALNLYTGLGISTFFGDPFELGIAGEIGLEYRFNKIPLAMGLDWRPVFRIIEQTDFVADGFGLNVRYVFGSDK